MRHSVSAIAAVAAVAWGLAAASGAWAADANVAGSWAITGRIEADGAQAMAQPECVFQQAAGDITGSCKGPNAHGPAKGKVVGQKVSFRWETTSDTVVGLTGTATFEGELGAGGTIHGTWSISQLPGATGEFTGQRK